MSLEALKDWREKRRKFVRSRSLELTDDDVAKVLNLGAPVEEPTSVRDDVTVKCQQAELACSARPVPPFPFPIKTKASPPRHRREAISICCSVEANRKIN